MIAKLGTPGTLLFVSAGIVIFLVIFDLLIEYRPFGPRTFWALLDGLVHGILALVVVLPAIKSTESDKRVALLFWLVLLTATLIDIDHFVAAGGLSMEKALHLAVRPPTHSLTFALVVAAIVLLFSRNPTMAWLFFAALASHVLRDASSGLTQILWPLSVQSIPWWIYYPSEVALFLISYMIGNTSIVKPLGFK